MSIEDLDRLFQQEKAKELEEKEIAAENEEWERIFNTERAKADFEHWSKAMYWTLDEAVALTLGRSPEYVNSRTMKSYQKVSAFARQYARMRDLAARAEKWEQLQDPIAPGQFLAWAQKTGIAVPRDLMEAVERRGVVIADWKDALDTLRAQFDALTEEHEKVSSSSQKILQERDALRTNLSELTEQATSWQFDEEAENYPLELDLAMQAWRGVATNRDPGLTVKQQLIAWLNQHYPKLTGEATERIATVANWEKRGGRPAQS